MQSWCGQSKVKNDLSAELTPNVPRSYVKPQKAKLTLSPVTYINYDNIVINAGGTAEAGQNLQGLFIREKTCR